MGQLPNAVCCSQLVVGDLQSVQDWEAACRGHQRNDIGCREYVSSCIHSNNVGHTIRYLIIIKAIILAEFL